MQRTLIPMGSSPWSRNGLPVTSRSTTLAQIGWPDQVVGTGHRRRAILLPPRPGRTGEREMRRARRGRCRASRSTRGSPRRRRSTRRASDVRSGCATRFLDDDVPPGRLASWTHRTHSPRRSTSWARSSTRARRSTNNAAVSAPRAPLRKTSAASLRCRQPHIPVPRRRRPH